MPAWMVSITTAVRRRAVVVGEKTAVELNGVDGAISLSNDGDEQTLGGKDLDHSVTADTLIEKPKEFSQVRKTIGNSAVITRRPRKFAASPEKPRWRTVLSVLIKNLLLLIVVIALVLAIRKMALNSADVPLGTMIGVSEFEVRIAEVEAFAKKMAKMMQVQVEVVDNKIGNEVGDLREELRKIDERDAEFSSQMTALGARNERLEKIVGELASLDVLTKQEFNKVYRELMQAKRDDSVGYLTSNNVIAVAKEIVGKEIERHAADGLGMVDHALATGGGSVVRHSEAVHRRLFDTRASGVHMDAFKMLTPSFGEPGQCFPLKGSNGFVEIRLRAAIIPKAITLEHVDESVSYDRSSAPKECHISGWLQGKGRKRKADVEKASLLAEFSYDLEKSYAQTYSMLELATSIVVDMVRLDILSNHGNPSFTCIYRLRVHGFEAGSHTVVDVEP